MTMKNALLALVPAALLAGGSTTLLAEEGENALALPASEFAPIQRYAITYTEPRQLAEFYIRDMGLKVRDANFEEGRDPKNPNNRVVIATIDDIDNPTVKGIQWRLGLKADRGGWEAVEAGLRRKCQRGPNADQWTREVCP